MNSHSVDVPLKFSFIIYLFIYLFIFYKIHLGERFGQEGHNCIFCRQIEINANNLYFSTETGCHVQKLAVHFSVEQNIS